MPLSVAFDCTMPQFMMVRNSDNQIEVGVMDRLTDRYVCR